MTTTSTSRPADPDADDVGGAGSRQATRRRSAADQARARRARRTAKIVAAHQRDPLAGRLRATGYRMPFVAVLVLCLGGGLAAVLWLNTLTDQAGLEANANRKHNAAVELQIEALKADIAAKNATPAIAAAAKAMGMVPAGDAAILVLPTDAAAAPSVIGTPTPVADPAVVAAQAQAAADAAAQAAAEAAAAQAAAAAAAAQSEAAAAQAAAEAAAAASAAALPPADQGADAATTTTAVSTTTPGAGG